MSPSVYNQDSQKWKCHTLTHQFPAGGLLSMSQLNASRRAHTDCVSNSQVFLGGWLISALEKDEIILANTYWNSLKKKKKKVSTKAHLEDFILYYFQINKTKIKEERYPPVCSQQANMWETLAHHDTFFSSFNINYSLSSLVWSYKCFRLERGGGRLWAFFLHPLFRILDIFRNGHIKEWTPPSPLKTRREEIYKT